MVATPRRQVLKHPAYVIDSVTHEIVATIGENGAKDPEVLSIRNPGRKLAVPKGGRVKGAKAYALGGDITVDPNADPNDPDIQNKIASGAVYFDAASNSVKTRPVATPRITPPAFNNSAGLVSNQGPANGGTPTQNAIYGAQTTQLGARQNSIVAQMQQLAASGQADAATAAYIAELRRSDEANRAYLEQQRQSAQSQTADQQKLINAQNDVPGNTAAALKQELQNEDAYKFTLAGLPQPVDVTTPGGAPLVNAPAGVRAKILTPAEVVQQQNQQSAVNRGAGDEAARIATAEASLNATASSRNVQQANLGVTVAGRAVTAANIQENQGSLDEARAQLAPPGQVYDAYSGTFMSPEAQNIAQAQRGIVFDQVNKEFVPRATLLDRTDDSGNILNTKTGNWQDPQSGNVFVNGTWTDPKHGGVFDDAHQVWNYPDGSRFFVDPRNPDHGYTMDADGFILGGNGEWSRRTPDGYGGYTIQYKVPDAQGNLQLVESGSSGGGSISIDENGNATGGGAGGGSFASAYDNAASIDPATALATVKSVLPAFPSDQRSKAERVAIAESGGNPGAVGKAGEVGLWQIHPTNWAKLQQTLGEPINATTLKDPAVNARAAAVILGWGSGKWQANWTTAKGLGIP